MAGLGELSQPSGRNTRWVGEGHVGKCSGNNPSPSPLNVAVSSSMLSMTDLAVDPQSPHRTSSRPSGRGHDLRNSIAAFSR
jgi:hypothetical protein